MDKKQKGIFFTIPNLLSLFRLALIVVFVRLYSVMKLPEKGCIVLLVSGLTDILDGFIARRFNMVSDAGKILDPVADKLTQAAVLLCLAENHPMMLLLFSMFFVKECIGAILCILAIRKSRLIQSSHWHGKLNTVVLYAVFATHLIWPDMPQHLSMLLTYFSCLIMLLSFVLYSVGNFSVLLKKKKLH